MRVDSASAAVSALKEVTAALLASSVFVTFAARSFTSCKPQRTQFTCVTGTADARTPFTCITGTKVHILTLRTCAAICCLRRPCCWSLFSDSSDSRLSSASILLLSCEDKDF